MTDPEHAMLIQRAMDGISRANSWDQQSKNRRRALFRACINGDVDMARHMAYVGADNWSMALWHASYNGHLQIVELAVEYGVVQWPAVISGASAGGRSAILQWAANAVSSHIGTHVR